MRRFRVGLAVAAVVAVVPATQANATPDPTAAVVAAPNDRTGTVTTAQPFTWAGTTATGLNTTDFNGDLECGKDPTNYCDGTLLQIDLPIPDDMLPAPGLEPQTVFFDATVSVTINNYSPDAVADFDLNVFASDSTGAQGDQIDSSGNNPGDAEKVTVPVESTATVNPDGTVDRQETSYALVEAVYFTVLQSNYQGTAKFVG